MLVALAALHSVAAAASPRLVLLISEERLEGAPRFWWQCGARDPQPFADALGAQLERRELHVLDRCEEAAVHGSFARPNLTARDGANIASAVDADISAVGSVRMEKAEAPTGLGVVRYRAHLKLHLVRADGASLGEVSVTRDGFGAGVGEALETARQLLLIDAMNVIPDAIAGSAETPALWVRLAIAGNAETRLRFREALVKVPGVTKVSLAALRATATTFSVVPLDARYAVASALAAAGVAYEFTESP